MTQEKAKEIIKSLLSVAGNEYFDELIVEMEEAKSEDLKGVIDKYAKFLKHNDIQLVAAPSKTKKKGDWALLEIYVFHKGELI